MQAINGNELSAEDREKYYNVWNACDEADIDTPEEVLEALRIEQGCSPIKESVEIDENDVKQIENLVKNFKEKYGEGVDLRILSDGLIEGLYSITIVTD